MLARVSLVESHTHSEVERAVLMVKSAHEVRQPLLVARKTIGAHRDQDGPLPIHLGSQQLIRNILCCTGSGEAIVRHLSVLR